MESNEDTVILLADFAAAGALIPLFAMSTILGRELKNQMADAYEIVIFCKGTTRFLKLRKRWSKLEAIGKQNIALLKSLTGKQIALDLAGI
jgi:hypothetical protein